METAGIASRGLVVALAAWMAGNTALAAAGTCRPAQSVTPAQESASSSVVSVYWDISGTMSFSEAVTRQVVNTLDSSILQLARAKQIRHYTIGNAIEEKTSARDVRIDPRQDTALHKAAEHAGMQLARRQTSAAIIVSDLDLDIPDADLRQKYACPGVPMPANSKAGAIFGRCFAAGLSAGRSTTLPDVVMHAFLLQPGNVVATSKKKAPRLSRFFVLILGRDVGLTRSVIALMKERWNELGAQELALVDSRHATDVLSAPVTCSWTDQSLYEIVRSRNAGSRDQCFFLCTDEDGRGRLSFPVKRPTAQGGLLRLTPRRVTGSGARVTMSDTQATMEIDCPDKRRRAYEPASATVHYEWRSSPPTIAAEENARALLTGLMAVLPEIVQPRSVTVTVQQR